MRSAWVTALRADSGVVTETACRGVRREVSLAQEFGMPPAPASPGSPNLLTVCHDRFVESLAWTPSSHCVPLSLARAQAYNSGP